MSDDAMREVRSMVLLTSPCPPLPLLANLETFDRDMEDRVVTDAVSNSHDLIAHLMNRAIHVQVNTRDFHEQRVLKQRAAEKTLFESIDQMTDDGSMDVEKVYSAFQRYTRDYVASFLSPQANHDLRFMPLSEVCLSDPILLSARSFVKAQDTLYGRHPSIAPDGVADKSIDIMTYSDTIRVCANRIASAREVNH